MTNIAICDDEPQEIERARNFINMYIQEHPEHDIAADYFGEPLELISFVEEHGGSDILMLDVYMEGMLGTEAARRLRRSGYSGEIIFLTTSRDHALDAFEVDAAQYLIKPYTESSVFSALDKVFSRLKLEQRHVIALKTSEGIVRLSMKDVVFTETGRNNYQVIHTIQGEKMEVRMTSSELFRLLSQTKLFVRCGASLNLNLKFVRQIKKDFIILDSRERLAYPYRVYKELKEQFLCFQMSSYDRT